jgi:hypothetical protein
LRSEHGQDDPTLELAGDLRAELLLALVVGAQRVGDDELGQRVGGQPLDAARVLDQLVAVERDRIEGAERGPQLFEVPVLGEAVGGADDVRGHHVLDHRADPVVHVLALEHPAALLVHDLALAVHDVVVLEHVLARLEVLRLDLPLRRRDRARHPLVLDRDVIGDLHRGEDPVHPVGLEQAHQLVLQRQVEPRLTRVALAAGATAQLVVDAARLVPLGADDRQAAELGDLVVLGLDLLLEPLQRARPLGLVLVGRLHRVEATAAQVLVGEELRRAAEHDVGAATGHVGGHGDRALVTGHRDDRRLTLVLLGVQHLVRDAPAAQQRGQVLALLHAHRAHQHRLAGLVPGGDVVGDGRVLRLLGAVDEVGVVVAADRLVGRDRDHAEVVGLVELAGLGHRGAGHTGELLVQAEVVLQRDRRERLVLLADPHLLLASIAWCRPSL